MAEDTLAAPRAKPIARRHHFLPQGYLASFTDTGTKEGQFFVLEAESGRCFITSPKNVAAERDFNRVDIEGQSPDVLEQALAPFENQVVQAIRSAIATETFPGAEECNLVLNLLGLLAVRNPYFRGSFNRAREQSIHQIGEILVSDKRIWDHHIQKAKEAGEDIDETVPFEDFKRFVEERRYRIEFAPEGNLRVEFKTFDKLLPILGERTWSLFVAPADGPEFVCSDHPVTLVRKKGRGGPVGYALRETEVFFSLGRRVGFYGAFEDPLRPVVRLNSGGVSAMNRRVVQNAERHVYSALPAFAMWHEGQVMEVGCEPGQ
jgi:hypothetical protein